MSRWLRTAAWTGLALWSIGLFATGLVVGHHVRKTSPVPPADVVIKVNTDTLDALQPGGSLPVPKMPSVLGLNVDAAKAVISDAGLNTTAIKLADVPRAGATGIVTSQTPDPGTDAPGTVTLNVSVAAKVPDLAGKTQRDAEQALLDLGARTTAKRHYQAGATIGTVIAVDPAAGSALPEVVALTVADAPASGFLTALRAIDAQCQVTKASVAGTTSEHALVCPLGPVAAPPRPQSYDLSKKVDSITGGIGLSDDSALDAVGHLEILLDGQSVGSYDVTFGTLTPLTLPTAGKLRLEFEWSTTTAPATGTARLVLTELSVLGDQVSIDQLFTP